jgi:hypothetical protein
MEPRIEETTLSHEGGQNQDIFQSRYAEFEREVQECVIIVNNT